MYWNDPDSSATSTPRRRPLSLRGNSDLSLVEESETEREFKEVSFPVLVFYLTINTILITTSPLTLLLLHFNTNFQNV